MPTVSLTRLSDAHSGSARPQPTDEANGPARAVRARREFWRAESEEAKDTFRHGQQDLRAAAGALTALTAAPFFSALMSSGSSVDASETM